MKSNTTSIEKPTLKEQVSNTAKTMNNSFILDEDRTDGVVLTNSAANDIINNMLQLQGAELSQTQLQQLKESLQITLSKYQIQEDTDKSEIIKIQEQNAKVLRDYINAKRVEGRSNTTLYNYAKELTKLFVALNKSYSTITSQDIRDYLAWRKETGRLSSSTIANMRMYLLSFFKWLFVEELIKKNPMDRIGPVKVEKRVIEVLSDEEQEIIRCACTSERDIAIIDLLSGSGMRVSELCSLNISDVDFTNGEIKVFGKGAKERICFMTGKSKVHLKWYLESRDDDNKALFVTAKQPHSRLTKNGVEFILKSVAAKSKVPTTRLYPHKFRSTLATNMINKGASAESVQGILGHSSVDTTLKCYCKVDKDTYKRAHRQFA